MGTEQRELKKLLDKIMKRHKQLSDQLSPLIKNKDDLVALLDVVDTKADEAAAIKSQVDELKGRIDELAPALKDICESYPRVTKAIKSLERRAGLQPSASSEIGPSASPGTQFAHSEIFKNYVDSGGHQVNMSGTPGQKIDLAFRGTWHAKRRGSKMQTKAGELDADALTYDWRRPDVIEINRVTPIHRDWLTVIELDEAVSSVRVDRELAELMLVATITTALVATNTTVDLDSVAGLSDEATSVYNKFYVQLNGGALEGPKTISPGGIAENLDGSGTLTFTPAMVGAAAIGNLIQADQFRPTAKCKVSPKNQDKYETINVPINRITTYQEACDEVLEDATRLADLIDRRLMSKYARMEQKAVFYGNGTSPEPLGFFNDPAISVLLWSTLPVGKTKLDAILYAVTQIAIADYFPNVALVNWLDVRDIWGEKDNENRYIFIQAMTGAVPAMLWMVQIVPTNAVISGDALVMDSNTAATLYVRQDAEIMIGLINQQFIEHKRCVRITGRVGFSVESPLAVVILKFDSEPV